MAVAAPAPSPELEVEPEPEPARLDWVPWSNVTVGPRWDVAPLDRRTRLHASTELGVILVLYERPERMMLLPTAGFVYDAGASDDFLFATGLGLGWMHPIGGAAVRPRAVLGSNDEGFVGGLRTTVMGFVLSGLFNVGVSYQFTREPAGFVQSIALEFGVNSGAFGWRLRER